MERYGSFLEVLESLTDLERTNQLEGIILYIKTPNASPFFCDRFDGFHSTQKTFDALEYMKEIAAKKAKIISNL